MCLPSPEETPVMMSAELSGKVLPEYTGQPEPKTRRKPGQGQSIDTDW